MDAPSGKAPSYNLNNPSVKRLLKEYRELQKEASDQFTAAPLEEDIFEWHFTIRGPEGTDFAGGIYHGRILLPQDYPFKPPDFVFLTPNGRFEVGKKICLTVTSYHSESWQPSWSIRTALLAITGFMPTKAEGAIGGLDYTAPERKKLAEQSTSWKCDKCGVRNATALPDAPSPLSPDIRSSNSNLRVSQISFTVPSPASGDANPAAAPPPTPPASQPPTPNPSPRPPLRPVSPVPSAARLPGAPVGAAQQQQQLHVAPQAVPRRDTKFLDSAIVFLLALIAALLWAKLKGQ